MNERPELNEIWITDRNGNKIANLVHLLRSLRMSGLALAKSSSPEHFQHGEQLTMILSDRNQDTNKESIQYISELVINHSCDMPSEVYRAQGCTLTERTKYAIDEARKSHYLNNDTFTAIFEAEAEAWCSDHKCGVISNHVEQAEPFRVGRYIKQIIYSAAAYVSDPDARTKSRVLRHNGIAMSVREAKINGLHFDGQVFTDDYMPVLLARALNGSLHEKAIFIMAKWNRSMLGCKQVYFNKSDIEGVVKVNLLGAAHIKNDYHVVATIEGVGDVLIDRLMRI